MRRTLPCVGHCDAPRAKRRVLSCAGACDDGRAGGAPGARTGCAARNCFSTPCGRRFSRSGEALHSHEKMDAKAAEERRFPCTPVKSCSASHPAEQKGGLSAHACKDRAACAWPDLELPHSRRETRRSLVVYPHLADDVIFAEIVGNPVERLKTVMVLPLALVALDEA